ncbi:MAG TPA: PA14 domain-containing protein, partial [Pirellulales bacterium]
MGLFALIGVLAAPALAQDDEDAPPGLVATYTLSGQAAPAIIRSEAAPAMRMALGTSPDPRLPESGWKVRWTGVLRVLRPGKYRFWIASNGPSELALDGKSVLKASGGAEPAASDEVELKFGGHPIVVDFAAEKPAAAFRVYWQGENFAKEPLSPLSLEHDEGADRIDDVFAVGRLSIEEHSCVACHAATAGSPAIGKSLIQRPGPKLSSAGTRLKAGWIYQWLGDPQAIRPESVMPKMFGED